MLPRSLKLIAGLTVIAGTPAMPHASAAVGLTMDPAKDGVAAGVSSNYKTAAEAQQRAMSECTSFKDAPAQTRAKCRIVANFENQCFSMALDPTAGQNGWGYSVDVSQAEADFEALEMCRLTSPDSRAGACIVTLRKCDGTAA